MGLWGLFGGGFQKHRRRGDEYRARGELGFAKAEYEAALRAARGRGEEEIAELKGALAEMRRELSRVQRSKGDTLREDGFFDEAQDAYHLALELCEGEGDREAVLAALRGLEKARREEASRQPELAPEGDEFLGESLEERFEIFLMGIEDPEVVQAYREQGPDFARILLKLQEGAAEVLIQMRVPAVPEKLYAGLSKKLRLLRIEPGTVTAHCNRRGRSEVLPQPPLCLRKLTHVRFALIVREDRGCPHRTNG